MLLYFDKNGTLKEALTYGPTAKSGTTNFEIFAFFEDTDLDFYSIATIKLRKPDLQRNAYPSLLMERDSIEFDNTIATSNFFQSGQTYEGYKFDFSSFNQGDGIIVLLDIPGLWQAIVSLYGNGVINVQGVATFTVENGVSIAEETDLTVEDVLPEVYAELSKKVSLIETVNVIDSVSDLEIEKYTDGQLFFENATKSFFKLEHEILVPFRPYSYTLEGTTTLEYISENCKTPCLFSVNGILYVFRYFFRLLNNCSFEIEKLSSFENVNGRWIGLGSINLTLNDIILQTTNYYQPYATQNYVDEAISTEDTNIKTFIGNNTLPFNQLSSQTVEQIRQKYGNSIFTLQDHKIFYICECSYNTATYLYDFNVCRINFDNDEKTIEYCHTGTNASVDTLYSVLSSATYQKLATENFANTHYLKKYSYNKYSIDTSKTLSSLVPIVGEEPCLIEFGILEEDLEELGPLSFEWYWCHVYYDNGNYYISLSVPNSEDIYRGESLAGTTKVSDILNDSYKIELTTKQYVDNAILTNVNKKLYVLNLTMPNNDDLSLLAEDGHVDISVTDEQVSALLDTVNSVIDIQSNVATHWLFRRQKYGPQHVWNCIPISDSNFSITLSGNPHSYYLRITRDKDYAYESETLRKYTVAVTNATTIADLVNEIGEEPCFVTLTGSVSGTYLVNLFTSEFDHITYVAGEFESTGEAPGKRWAIEPSIIGTTLLTNILTTSNPNYKPYIALPSDNLEDAGDSSHRFRDIYFGRYLKDGTRYATLRDLYSCLNEWQTNSNQIWWSKWNMLDLEEDTTITFETAKTGCYVEYKATIFNQTASSIVLTFPSGVKIITNDEDNVIISGNTITLTARTTIEINCVNNNMVAINFSAQ